MNIDNLTYGELKNIASLFCNNSANQTNISDKMKGKKFIFRTYSAGVHYGEFVEREGSEVLIKDSRRLYYWKTKNNGISLSEVAKFGLHEDSKVCTRVPNVITPIEIIGMTDEAIESIEGFDDFVA